MFHTSSRRPFLNPRIQNPILRIIARCAIVLLTTAGLLVVGLCLICNLIFNGPSESARDMLTMSLLESSGMKWFPALFLGEDMVAQIQADISAELPSDISNTGNITINPGNNLQDAEWKDHPDGIRIEYVSGSTYNAYVMLIRDPSKVYLSASTEKFDYSIPGERITNQIVKEGAIAGINAGAFYDNGTSDPKVGSVPLGLVVSNGKVLWETGTPPQEITGTPAFAGFNKDNVLVVAKTMTGAQAMELGIRDGCCFGPLLIMDGQTNEEAYNKNSGANPRTAIGQRADGTVLFVCIDGRQAGSLGGSFKDMIDIMTEYGAVNACNLDGGSSTVMLYKDTYGKMGTKDEIHMINNYSLLQSMPRRMPTFFMVRPSSED